VLLAGAIQYLWPKLRCPIYATRFAANLAQAKLKDLDFRDEVNTFARSYMSAHAWSRVQIDWHIVNPKDTRQIGPFNVTWQPMAHSIPESNSIVLRTK
jgi:ribonuclease J